MRIIKVKKCLDCPRSGKEEWDSRQCYEYNQEIPVESLLGGWDEEKNCSTGYPFPDFCKLEELKEEKNPCSP